MLTHSWFYLYHHCTQFIWYNSTWNIHDNDEKLFTYGKVKAWSHFGVMCCIVKSYNADWSSLGPEIVIVIAKTSLKKHKYGNLWPLFSMMILAESPFLLPQIFGPLFPSVIIVSWRLINKGKRQLLEDLIAMKKI